MDNLLPYCGLTDAKIRASDKDLPVLVLFDFDMIVYVTVACLNASQRIVQTIAPKIPWPI